MTFHRYLLAEMATTLQTGMDAALTTTNITVQVVPRLNYNPTPPSIDIYQGDPSRDSDGAGFTDIHGKIFFTVRARVDTSDTEAGFDILTDMMDEETDISVASILMADQTLNGLAASVFVEGPTGLNQFVDAGSGGALLGTTWRVTLLNGPPST